MKSIKTRLTLNLKRNLSFFCSNLSESDLAVCNKFVCKILDIRLENSLSEIKVSFASKNPKEKNWKKIKRTHSNYVAFKDDSFPVCIQEARFLNEMGVEDFFWLKIEVLG
jgi:hypothetical protein